LLTVAVLEGHRELLSCVDWLSCSLRASLDDLAAHALEFCQLRCRLKSEGAGNAGRWMRPQPRMQNKKHTSIVTTVTPEHPAFPTQWF